MHAHTHTHTHTHAHAHTHIHTLCEVRHTQPDSGLQTLCVFVCVCVCARNGERFLVKAASPAVTPQATESYSGDKSSQEQSSLDAAVHLVGHHTTTIEEERKRGEKRKKMRGKRTR